MSDLITIKYSARHYSARKIAIVIGGVPGWCIKLKAGEHHSALRHTEEEARLWLGDHGLRKSKATKLLAAALRNQGDFANPNHKLRVHAPIPGSTPVSGVGGSVSLSQASCPS